MKIDEQLLAVGRVYALSLLGLAQKAGSGDVVAQDLDALRSVLAAQPDLVDYFSSPLIDEGKRGEFVEKTFRGKFDDLVVDTLQVMNRKGRLGLAAALAEAYRQAHDDLHGRVHATVTTAVPLTDSLRTKVEQAVLTVVSREGRSASTVELVETVDAALLGGMVVQLGDRKIDTSVAREVSMLAESLTTRTSREIQNSSAYVADAG